MLFEAYILSQFSFLLRHMAFCGMSGIGKMEKIQEHPLCVVYNQFSLSYSELVIVMYCTPYLHISCLRQPSLQVYESLPSPSMPNYIE